MSGATLASFIRQNKAEILSAWADKASQRLGLDAATNPQLLNELPDFLDEVCDALERPPEEWATAPGAAAHGRQRVTLGLDIGALAEEFGMVNETIIELAGREGGEFEVRELALLARLIARGTAESLRAYARLRDRQLAEEAARHFSFVAHELRTPLQAAQLAARLLSAGVGDGESHSARLRRAHDQLVQLVDTTLLEARLLGEPRLQLEQHDMRSMVEEALGNAHALAERKGVDLDFDGDVTEISVDRKLMVSAITNLVVNGVKFTPDGGRVRIHTQVLEDRVLFEVYDACGGLPEDLPAKLFQPFVQAGTDRSGFGLGLVIVKQAVEAHGGAVRVVNHAPEGCCFVVELPRNPTGRP